MTTTYKKVKDTIKRIIKNPENDDELLSFIPVDEFNPDYQKFLQWEADGNQADVEDELETVSTFSQGEDGFDNAPDWSNLRREIVSKLMSQINLGQPSDILKLTIALSEEMTDILIPTLESIKDMIPVPSQKGAFTRAVNRILEDSNFPEDIRM